MSQQILRESYLAVPASIVRLKVMIDDIQEKEHSMQGKMMNKKRD